MLLGELDGLIVALEKVEKLVHDEQTAKILKTMNKDSDYRQILKKMDKLKPGTLFLEKNLRWYTGVCHLYRQ